MLTITWPDRVSENSRDGWYTRKATPRDQQRRQDTEESLTPRDPEKK